VDDKNDDSYASGSIFHPPYDNDDDEEESPVSPARDMSLHNRSVGVDLTSPVVHPHALPATFTTGRASRGEGGGRGRWGVGRCRASGRGCTYTLPEEDCTGRKVAFPLDALVWPDYSRLLEFIKKNKLLQKFNRVKPPDLVVDGKIVALSGNHGTKAHKNKYGMFRILLFQANVYEEGCYLTFYGAR
jgi:hypothetical protein